MTLSESLKTDSIHITIESTNTGGNTMKKNISAEALIDILETISEQAYDDEIKIEARLDAKGFLICTHITSLEYEVVKDNVINLHAFLEGGGFMDCTVSAGSATQVEEFEEDRLIRLKTTNDEMSIGIIFN